MLDITESVKLAKARDKHIGARIRDRRKMLGVSQSTLAARLGVTFQQVQKYEKGTNRVGGSRMMAIAEALGVSPSFFFEGMSSAVQGTPAPLDVEIEQLVAQPHVLAMVRAFASVRDMDARRQILGVTQIVAAQQVH